MLKNKYKLKHVALCLALAGYSAGSALAFDATTMGSILGRPPILKNESGSTGTKHKIDAKIYRLVQGQPVLINTLPAADQRVRLDDIIKITYFIDDEDGDVEGTSGSHSTVKLFYKVKDQTEWKPVPSRIVQTKAGEITLTLTADVSNAVQFGLSVLEKTTYGSPRTNQWLQVSNIFNGSGNPTNPTDPTKPEESGPENPGDNEKPNPLDPIEPGKPVPPVALGDMSIGIYKVETGKDIDYTVNYHTSAVSPKIGEQFKVVLWLKKDDNQGKPPADETLHTTGNYTWQWQLTGDNTTAANGQASLSLANVNIKGATGQTYTIKTNAAYIAGGADEVSTDPKMYAGAQGFKLRVTSPEPSTPTPPAAEAGQQTRSRLR